MVREEKQKQKDKIQTYDIMESLIDASELLKMSSISTQDKKEIYQSLKGKLNIKYKDFQNKDSRRLLKQLVDAKLKEMKRLKSIVKTELKRKREDEKEKKEAKKVEEIGQKVKKESKKDKGKLRQLIKAIHSADPVKDKYIVANVV